METRPDPRTARPEHARAPLVALALALAAACGPAAPEPATTATTDPGAAALDEVPTAEPAAEPGAEPAGSWRRDRPSSEAGDAGQPQDGELARRMQALEEIGYAAGYEPAEGEDGVTFHAVGRPMPGLSLVVSGHAAEASLIDLEGNVVHRWARSFEDTWHGREGNAVRRGSWRRAAVLPDGGLLAIFTSLGLVRLDRDSELVWTWDGRAHHDLDVAADGSILVLTRRASVIPALHPTEPILEDFVTRLSPDGEELATVSIYRALLASPHAALLEELEGAGDVFHCNAVQWLDGTAAARSPELAAAFPRGAALVSVRQLDLLLSMDLERGTVLWTGRGSWRRQHEPTLLPGGTMLVFDNLSVPERSAVIEFDPIGGEELWVYRADADGVFFTSGAGTCQRLANGDTLVTESNAGRAFELTPEREIVWEWRSPHRAGDHQELVATLFDVHRLPPDFPLDWLER